MERGVGGGEEGSRGLGPWAVGPFGVGAFA